MTPQLATPASDSQIWQARAEALLDVFTAALNLTNRRALILGRRGGVYVNRTDYDKLEKSVKEYLALCNQ